MSTMIETMVKDEAHIRFETEEQASEFYALQALEDRWFTSNGTELTFGLIDAEPIALYWETDENCAAAIAAHNLQSCGTDAVRDTMRSGGTWGYLDIQGYGRYLLRTTALDGLKCRAGQEGRATENMYRQRRAEMYPMQVNSGLQAMNSVAQILVRDEKITAINSKDYQILPAAELYTELSATMAKRFPSALFEGGYYTHSNTELSWQLLGQASDLLKTYRKALTAAHSEAARIASFIPRLSFRTSDIGINCASVRAMMDVYLANKKRITIDLGDALRVEHRTNNSIATFRSACSMIYASYIDQTEKLADMLNIKIDSVGHAIAGTCKRMHLPLAIYRDACESYMCMSENDNAHDVFWAICGALTRYIEESQISGKARLRLEENAARILLMTERDWHDAVTKSQRDAGETEFEEDAA